MLTAPQFSPAGLDSVRRRIIAAARVAGRDPAGIRLVAVSKQQSADAIRAAHTAGQSDFGENYLQEAEPKIAALRGLAITWHFIGRLQANKTREIAASFDWVHSVDRERIATRLAEQRPPDRAAAARSCCRCGSATSRAKAGIDPDALPAARGSRERAAATRASRSDVHARTRDRARPRSARRSGDCANCCSISTRRGHSLDTLSMGMSGDLEAAIAEGATIVRVGTAIFGPQDLRRTRMRIAFIGGGNMATSLIGALRARGVDASSITVAEPVGARSAALAREYGIRATADNAAAAAGADTIVIAVKPQDVRQVATGIATSIADGRRLVVSVAAGIRLADLGRWLGGDVALVRAMPNRPALIGRGITALCAAPGVEARRTGARRADPGSDRRDTSGSSPSRSSTS